MDLKSSRIAIFGCKSTTLFLIKSLLNANIKVSHLITIDPQMGEKNEVADYCDLFQIVSEMGIKVYSAKHYSLKNEDDIAFCNGLKLDIAFVMGWQRLIPAEILSNIKIGAFGMHGSSMDLPLGRGRSPMNWSIIEGRKVFYTNLFKYSAGVDDGDVVDAYKFQITDKDTGESMHYKNLLSMKYLIERNITSLLENRFQLHVQRTDIEPTFYPKRSPQDGLIDWYTDIAVIERFIRAVTRPFSGAFTFVGADKMTIWDAQIFDHQDFGYTNKKEGEIVAVFPGGKFLIKCFGGLLLVNEYETKADIAEGIILHTNGITLKEFPRNKRGFFDV